MEYAEDDYLMISGIQHFRFCKRQWALIHIEQQWAENEHTVIGELMHKKAHDPYLTEKRRDTIIAKAEEHRGRQITISGAGNVPGRNVFHTDSGRCTFLRRDKTEGNRGDHRRTSYRSA